MPPATVVKVFRPLLVRLTVSGREAGAEVSGPVTSGAVTLVAVLLVGRGVTTLAIPSSVRCSRRCVVPWLSSLAVEPRLSGFYIFRNFCCIVGSLFLGS